MSSLDRGTAQSSSVSTGRINRIAAFQLGHLRREPLLLPLIEARPLLVLALQVSLNQAFALQHEFLGHAVAERRSQEAALIGLFQRIDTVPCHAPLVLDRHGPGQLELLVDASDLESA